MGNAIVSQNTSLLPIISNTSNMSDAFRQSTTDKATSALKPDSQKSGLEQAGDSIKNTADNVAGSVQPSGEKGMGQKATDAVSGTNNDASKQGLGMGKK